MGEASAEQSLGGGGFGVVHGVAMISHPPQGESTPHTHPHPPPSTFVHPRGCLWSSAPPSLAPAAPGGGLLGRRFGDDPLPLGRHHQQEGFPPSLHQHQVPGHAAHEEMRGRGSRTPLPPHPQPPTLQAGRKEEEEEGREEGRGERCPAQTARRSTQPTSALRHALLARGGPGARAPTGTRAEGGRMDGRWGVGVGGIPSAGVPSAGGCPPPPESLLPGGPEGTRSPAAAL